MRFISITFELTQLSPIQIECLHYDGCPIADLGLNFTLPGHANVELRRSGRDTFVTIHNLHQYVALVTNWFLVDGVQMQFDALREGTFLFLLKSLQFI